ncbi:DUF4349 domain-containing protein [Anaerococcus provencensis]|uniref:DUF4349 domain-containing protein n=1 Tax=Anaerococcus provencensis TaxID=938293 RepID=UPI000315E284|nr:DUF4349 domain-containing protein [Anaerococcus provencensis]
MTKRRYILISIIFSFMLVACVAGNTKDASVSNEITDRASTPAEMPSDMKTEEVAEEEGIDDGESLPIKSTDSERKIERFYDYYIETIDFDKDNQGIEELVSKYGGFYQSSTIDREFPNESDESIRILNASIKIPKDNSEKFRKDLESHGKILSSSNHINDFTKTYTDTSIRLKSKETELEKLNELLEKAENLEDVMAIQARILDVQAEIDQINAEISDMDSRVYYDTYNLCLREVYDYKHVANRSPDFAGRVSQAFGDSIHLFINFFQDLIIALITFWPLVLIAILIAFFVKYLVSKRKKKTINMANKNANEEKLD